MSEAKPYQPPEWQQTPPTSSSGSCLKWALLGCGGLMVVILVLCAGGTWWGWSWVNKQVAEFTAPLEAKGYTRQSGQVIEVKQSPKEKTVYVSQVLKIDEDVDVDIAAAAQVMEIHADVHGDVDFLGQMLKIDSGCVIDGDLRIKNAQVVEIHGEVKGDISGNYMVLTYKGKQYGSGQSPKTDSATADENADPKALEKARPPKPPEAPEPPPAPAKPPESNETEKP